jgi:hypothetical protein
MTQPINRRNGNGCRGVFEAFGNLSKSEGYRAYRMEPVAGRGFATLRNSFWRLVGGHLDDVPDYCRGKGDSDQRHPP